MEQFVTRSYKMDYGSARGEKTNLQDETYSDVEPSLAVHRYVSTWYNDVRAPRQNMFAPLIMSRCVD